MNRKNIFIILTLLICVSIALICNKNSDNTTLDEVKLKDNEINKKQFAMYIRESKSDEYQEYTGDNLFPVGYKLDLDESGCVDGDGHKVEEEGIITQTKDNKITLKSNKTVYCYLYFEKSGFNGTGKELLESNPDNLTVEPVADLYRYIGTDEQVTNNYICFGSDNCMEGENKENYLYRIIGIDNQNRLKLIKDKTIVESIQWHKNNTANAVWDNVDGTTEADLFSNLNNGIFLTDPSYVPEGWGEKIDKTAWNIGDVNDNSYVQTGGNAIYEQEKVTTVTTPSKIGLMYLSDYYYSLNGKGNLNCYDLDSSTCKTSWLHITNNTLSQNYTEWTMTRYGQSSNRNYHAWYVSSNGVVSGPGLNNTYAIRPVFYLTSDSKIVSGAGTNEEPFILEVPYIWEMLNKKGTELAKEKFNGEIPKGFKTIPISDMYRFVGTKDEDIAGNINNYVCFGSASCNGNETDNHLYRIIGITETENIKIQKNSAIGTSQWASNSNIKWPGSTVYSYLSGTNFYNSEKYVTEDMKNKIEKEHKWNIGDVGSTYKEATNGSYGETVYNLEKETQTHSGPIGLAYLSDYYYAYNKGGMKNCYDEYCSSWMITNYWQTLWSGESKDWTMTRYGGSSNYTAWYLDTSGKVGTDFLNYTHSFRPVFYLNSDVTLTTNGDSSDPKGSLNNPWIVEL